MARLDPFDELANLAGTEIPLHLHFLRLVAILKDLDELADERLELAATVEVNGVVKRVVHAVVGERLVELHVLLFPSDSSLLPPLELDALFCHVSLSEKRREEDETS